MKEQKKFNERLNIKVSPKILTNKELSENEKLILSLDYTYSFKKGHTIYTNVDIGKLFSLHENIIGLCRRSLITKGYLIKDTKDKRIHYLTDKLMSVELPIINEEKQGKYESQCILPFEIYNHSELTTGAKLLWGEYNTLSKTKHGYVKKRKTTSKIMNVSVGSITNWTKQLFDCNFLKVYVVNYGYYTNQKVIRTIEFNREISKSIDEFGDILDDGIKDYGIKNELPKKEVYTALIPAEEKSDLKIEKKGKKSISEDIDFKESFEKEEVLKENLWDNPSSPLGGITKFSDLPIEKKKKKKKNKSKDVKDEDSDFEEL